MSVKDNCMLLVKIDHIHLALGASLPVELLLIVWQVSHRLLLRLQLTHHLERVCRLSLLFLDNDKVNVRPLIRLVVLKQKASCLRDRVLVHDHINVEDAIGL